MTTEHPITPPPELVQQWDGHGKSRSDAAQILATQAARWGWDQRGTANEAELQKARDEELEACCMWLIVQGCFHPKSALIEDLRAARRPKPPSLKELALAALKRQAVRSVPSLIATEDCDTIRKALEALPND